METAKFPLSQLIRLGSLIRPQAIGYTFEDGKSCAIAAAFEAVGIKKLRIIDTIRNPTDHPWSNPTFYTRPGAIRCPKSGCTFRAPFSILACIIHLNDHHKWTRPQIADWVEKLEKEQEAKTDRLHEVPVSCSR